MDIQQWINEGQAKCATDVFYIAFRFAKDNPEIEIDDVRCSCDDLLCHTGFVERVMSPAIRAGKIMQDIRDAVDDRKGQIDDS